MNSAKIEGRIIAILPVNSGTSKNGGTWKNQDYVIETISDNYPKKVHFNVWGDNIDKFDIQMGEVLSVEANIESQEYNGRWYLKATAWRVSRGDKKGAEDSQSPANAPQTTTDQRPVTDFTSNSGDSEMPF